MLDKHAWPAGEARSPHKASWRSTAIDRAELRQLAVARAPVPGGRESVAAARLIAGGQP